MTIMIDIKRIKEDPEGVKAGLRAKEVDCDAQIDRLLELDGIFDLKDTTLNGQEVNIIIDRESIPVRGEIIA